MKSKSLMNTFSETETAWTLNSNLVPLGKKTTQPFSFFYFSSFRFRKKTYISSTFLSLSLSLSQTTPGIRLQVTIRWGYRETSAYFCLSSFSFAYTHSTFFPILPSRCIKNQFMKIATGKKGFGERKIKQSKSKLAFALIIIIIGQWFPLHLLNLPLRLKLSKPTLHRSSPYYNNSSLLHLKLLSIIFSFSFISLS